MCLLLNIDFQFVSALYSYLITPLTNKIPESFLIAFDQESLDEIAVARKSKSLLESFKRDGVL